MCLIAFAYKVSPEYPLILIANRDEFYDRPAQQAHFWKEENQPGLLAGKDLKAGGTWLGMHKNGKWGAVTNHRDIKKIKQNAPTRGDLIPQFLKAKDSAYQYLSALKEEAAAYNGFNLLLGDEQGIFHYSNISNEITEIEPGIHGLSNALLNTPWPKLERAKEMLEDKIQKNNLSENELFAILKDQAKAQENQLPDTGLPKSFEKAASSIFIDTENYGTRCSTLIVMDKNGETKFVERRFSNGDAKKEEETFLF